MLLLLLSICFGNSVLCYFILDVLIFADESCFFSAWQYKVIKYYCLKVNICKRHTKYHDVVIKWLNIITVRANMCKRHTLYYNVVIK